MELSGRTAVVTGAGSGIGRGLALALAEAGMNVVVSDIEPDAAAAVVKEVEGHGRQALAVQTDVSSFADVERLADLTYQEFGSADVLCNNAGVFLMGPITDMIVEDWRWVFDVNLMGVVHGIHAFVPRMTRQGGGHILNTSSVAALGGGGIYGASKSALLALSETLHEELGPAGIGVSVLCPGNISSRILGAQRNRPTSYGRKAAEPFGTDITDFGLDPLLVGRRARVAIEAGELYVFAFPTGWEDHVAPRARERYNAILAAIDTGGIASEGGQDGR
jgi:NAD(P)-dependent dehydrogenase (short-subunit alcohol dehydrogenase family)